METITERHERRKPAHVAAYARMVTDPARLWARWVFVGCTSLCVGFAGSLSLYVGLPFDHAVLAILFALGVGLGIAGLGNALVLDAKEDRFWDRLLDGALDTVEQQERETIGADDGRPVFRVYGGPARPVTVHAPLTVAGHTIAAQDVARVYARAERDRRLVRADTGLSGTAYQAITAALVDAGRLQNVGTADSPTYEWTAAGLTWLGVSSPSSSSSSGGDDDSGDVDLE